VRSPIQLPTRILPAPETRALPAAVPLRRMLGPGIILAGLSIGSGEFVLWPRLTAQWGFAVFWAAWIGVLIQFFLNMEIGRYTLATGESAVIGFLRLSRGWALVMLVCGSLPFIWPGWATGAGTILSWELGGNALAWAVGGLVLCGLILSVGPVVYRTVESIMVVLVGTIFLALCFLAFKVVEPEHVRALFAGALRVGHIPEGVDLPLLLGALAFAGAGGTLNLAHSNYIRDKGYGMGSWVGRITSPITGRQEVTSDVGYVFDGEATNLERWRVWWRRSNTEHGISFLLLCLVSISLLTLIAYALLEPGAEVGEDFGFIRDQGTALNERFGARAMHVFFGAGVAVLFSTELALLDGVSRVLTDLVHGLFCRAGSWGLSRLYFTILWTLIGFGVLVLLLGVDQPLTLLVLSASLNAIVMFLYSGLLLWLNLRCFHGPLRPGPVRIVALLVSLTFFGYFSILTIWSQLARLFSG
jgi:hypothetical protein